MKAIVCTRYGSPDMLRLEEVETPIPGEGEVLVKVHAASLNATDMEILKGWLLVRLFSPLKPRYEIPGSDFAGRVERAGENVERLKPGDEVFADLSEYGMGALAEYVCVPERALTLKPAGVSFEEAAALPQAGVLALQGVRDKRQLQAGHKVLINGAGGGVGTIAIQLAKLLDVEVTGVDRPSKFDMLRSLGADHLIDYTQEDFTRTGQRYDLILDVVASRSAFALSRSLKPEGVYAMVGGSTGTILQIASLGTLISRLGNRSVGILVGRQNKKEDLLHLLELLEAGKVTPVIDHRFPLGEAAEAFSRLAAGEVVGKVIIRMEDGIEP